MLFDYIPRFANLQFDKKYLVLGGVLSGFFANIESKGPESTRCSMKQNSGKRTKVAIKSKP